MRDAIQLQFRGIGNLYIANQEFIRTHERGADKAAALVRVYRELLAGRDAPARAAAVSRRSRGS